MLCIFTRKRDKPFKDFFATRKRKNVKADYF